ncbi:putative RDD family membrane protein YckC [Pontibacter aydingkolensis]|uniref:RDD family protein n=1 Tax=Pontibacter aydingkolensis TaxID=1911536 RepID=A0ABS7CTZ7_9BACT|nr:RDD family protein [Pontibacter aydingkolensis]MBW7467316.1 RDD family protein [Pontibacter aydingkolensis]
MEHLDTKQFETNDPFLFDDEAVPLYDVSKNKRFLHHIIDTIAFYAFAIVIGIALGLAGMESILAGINDMVLGLLIMFTYYWGFESIFGQTVGKMITGSIVVTEDGEKITPLDALKRTLCRFIPFEVFSFLGSGPGWHDTISRTRVVKK